MDGLYRALWRTRRGFHRADSRQQRSRGVDDGDAPPGRGALGRRRDSRRPGRRAERPAGALLPLPRQSAPRPRRPRLPRRARLLPLHLERRRPRPAEGDDHSALPSARPDVAGARRLRARLGLGRRRLAGLHRRGGLARGEGAHHLRGIRRHGRAEADRGRRPPPARHPAPGGGRPPPGGAPGPPRDTLPSGERAVFDWVARKGEVEINRANGPGVAKAFASFKAAVEGESRNRFFRRNLGWFGLGAALTAGAVLLVLFFGGLRESEVGLLIGAAFVGVFAGVFVGPVIRAIFGARNPRSIVAAGINIVAFVVIGATVLSLFGPAVRSLPDDFTNLAVRAFLANSFPFLLVGGFAALNGLFYYLLRAPTAAGRAVMDRIEGLELYIRTAETARLDLAGAPDLTTTQFERILPYAIALDAEKPWSEAFAAAFARAHPGEDVALAYAPAWHGGRGWGGGDFGRALASSVSAAEGSFQSAVPPPASSSSGFSGGGGGGSGGGGGGGGGGGW